MVDICVILYLAYPPYAREDIYKTPKKRHGTEILCLFLYSKCYTFCYVFCPNDNGLDKATFI